MFNQYPYLNLNDLNLDYLLNEMKSMYNEVTNFVSINAIKYANPIQWNITSQYEKNTVVIDPLTGTAYISVAAVPSGVALTRTEYWTVVFDLGAFVTRAAQNFTSRWESETTLTATFPTNTGEWLVWGDVLYKAISNIVAGDQYVVGSNIEHFTIEDLYNAYLNTVAQILAAIGNLTDLSTSDKSSIVNAINEINDVTIPKHYYNVKDFGAKGDGTTDDTALIQSLIDEYNYLYFPTGEYVISDKITHAGKCSIMGDGMGNSKLKFTGANAGIVINMSIISGQIHLKEGVQVSNITLQRCDNSGGTAITIDGTLTNSFDRSNLTTNIEYVQIMGDENNGYWQNGIHLNNCNCSAISHCSIVGNAGANIDDGTFLSDDAIYYSCDDVTHATEFMTDNNKICAWHNGVRMGEHTEGLQVVNSTIILVGRGIFIDAAVDGFTHASIVNNHIWAMEFDILAHFAKQVMIADNLFYLASGEYAVAHAMQFDGGGSQQIIIHDNVISMTDYGTYPKTGIYILGGEYYQIHDNIIRGNSHAFYLDMCSNVTIHDNDVMNVAYAFEMSTPALANNGIRYIPNGSAICQVDLSNSNPHPGDMFDPGDGIIRWVAYDSSIKALTNL